MSPLEFAHAVLLAVSFGLSLIVLAIIALILEAIMFALGRLPHFF
jgi:hypothetical protein